MTDRPQKPLMLHRDEHDDRDDDGHERLDHAEAAPAAVPGRTVAGRHGTAEWRAHAPTSAARLLQVRDRDGWPEGHAAPPASGGSMGQWTI